MSKKTEIFTIERIAHGLPYANQNETMLLVEKKSLNDAFPLHRHEYLELELILKGTGTEWINGYEHPLRKGMFYLLRPSDFHEYYSLKDVELITISFDYSLLPPPFQNEVYSADKGYICYAQDFDFEYLTALFEAFKKECESKHPMRDLHLQNLISCILIMLLRLTSTTLDTTTEYSNPILPALNYINLHFTDDPSIHDMAKIVHLNPSYFSAIFKKHTNKSYIDYLTNLKINYAKKLISTNKFTIMHVASVSGFNSINNFSRTFKKYVGMSPTAYQNSLMEPPEKT